MGQVVQVIDHHHHQMKNTTRPIQDLENDVTVGSCSTLVAQRYLTFCQDEDLIDVQIILLLFGPIVLGEKADYKITLSFSLFLSHFMDRHSFYL